MKKGIVLGTWDFLHAGHIHLLRECRKSCDALIVGLHVDPSIQRVEKNKPVESVLERQIRLLGCKYVDGIVVYEEEANLPVLFKYFHIDVRFLGSDYKDTDKYISFRELVPIEYIDSIDIHSSDLRKRL